MMKVISRYRLGDLKGTLYETILRGDPHYEYRVRFHKQVVARSYVYFRNKEECLNRMKSDMEQLFDSQRLV